MAAMPNTGVDLMLGTGGTPEGVLAAAAIRILGGEMLTRLDPQSEGERRRLLEAEYALDVVLTAEDLVAGDDILFAATGITGGSLMPGVRYHGGGDATTTSVVMRGRTGTWRTVEARHSLDKLMHISAVEYAKCANC